MRCFIRRSFIDFIVYACDFNEFPLIDEKEREKNKKMQSKSALQL